MRVHSLGDSCGTTTAATAAQEPPPKQPIPVGAAPARNLQIEDGAISRNSCKE